jgi:hypothetical protein
LLTNDRMITAIQKQEARRTQNHTGSNKPSEGSSKNHRTSASGDTIKSVNSREESQTRLNYVGNSYHHKLDTDSYVGSRVLQYRNKYFQAPHQDAGSTAIGSQRFSTGTVQSDMVHPPEGDKHRMQFASSRSGTSTRTYVGQQRLRAGDPEPLEERSREKSLRDKIHQESSPAAFR